MAYKTILAHFRDESGLQALLGPSIDLARQFDAHLLGLAVVPPYIFQPAYMPGVSSIVIDEHRKIFVEEAKRMRAAFEAAAKDAGVSSEWVDDDASLSPVWRRVVEYANAADLTIALNPSFGVAPLAEDDEQLALHIGRPVLFIPRSGSHVGLGRHVLVAWNGRRESARAAFDALPLLKGADLATVVWINPDQADGPSALVPAADLCTALARHKVKCEAAERSAPDASVGEVLLAQARESQCDLVVMGCYGHARLREFVLGGATRYVLQHATVPVLMAH